MAKRLSGVRGSFEERMSALDGLIKAFAELIVDYPEGGYEDSLAQLQAERAELAQTIGSTTDGTHRSH